MALFFSQKTQQNFLNAHFRVLGRNIAPLHFKTETVAATAFRASWFWPTSDRFPGTWAIFFTLGDSKLTPDGLALQWNGHRKTFLPLLRELLGYTSPRSSKVSVQKVLLCPFNCKLRPSEVSLASPGIESIRQLPGNRAEVGQNYNARKAVSPTLSVLKWSGAIFRPRSSKLCFQKILLFQFHCKTRSSGPSL